MAHKRWTIGVTAFLSVALILAGFAAFAAETGSKGDPALSLSYITEEFQPAIMARIEDAVKRQTDEYAADMTARINTLAAQIHSDSGLSGPVDLTSLLSDSDFIAAVAAAVIEQLPDSSGSNIVSSVAGGWARVDISNGKTFAADMGTEIVLRLGSATCVAASSPGLINITTAGVLENNRALEANNHYLCTIAGRGFKATSDVTVFVRGGYTVN